MSFGQERVRLQGVDWCETFPFVADFGQVVRGDVSVEYLKQLGCVLEPVVSVCTAAVEGGTVTKETVGCLFFAVNALARLQVALAYQTEVQDSGVSRESLLEALLSDWEMMAQRECLVDVKFTPAVDAVVGASVRTVWISFAMQRMYTAREMCACYPAFITDVRVVPVAQVLVVGECGKPLAEVLHDHGDKLVLPVDVFRHLWARLKGVDVSAALSEPPVAVLAGRIDSLDVGYGYIESSVVMSWLWVLLASMGDLQGYCYQLMFPPVDRLHVCTVLQQQPLVDDVLWQLRTVDIGWSTVKAHVTYGEILHVSTAGCADVDVLAQYSHRRIGMDVTSTAVPDVDYYARALVDEFIEKHKPLPAVPVIVPPLDAEFDKLSVSTESNVGREFVDVASLLYAAVDETISPRAELADVGRTGAGVGDDLSIERDSEIVQQIYNRLADGAVIDESYFERTYRRFRRLHRRPRLDQSNGRMYHVFEGFPAEGGAGLGPWELDKNWGIPGWQSYVAEFDKGDALTVSFSVAGGCQDVRMDCSGEGAIELGDCKVRVAGTLLWFTNSIRLRLVAKSDVCLRISVPDALAAIAMGSEMRRYMHIPGYAVVARSYDVVVGNVDLSIPVERVKRNSIAGCHVYSGQRYVERGRHRFKLSQVASLAPARMLFKTEPPDALEHISVCGMRLRPRTRDHVSALVDLRNVEMYVSAYSGATLWVSMMQVVRTKEFEIAMLSAQEAKMAKSVRR